MLTRSSVLEAGEIAERATHLELLDKNRLYASMWARQREAEERLRAARENDELGIVIRGQTADFVPAK